MNTEADANALANIELAERMYRDDFDVLLLRQGWTLTKCRPLYSDPEVLAIRKARHPLSLERGPSAWHMLLAVDTCRKLLRSLINGPRNRKQLLYTCKEEKKLDWYLQLFADGGLITANNGIWDRGSGCGLVRDMGHTFEWYVAEWYRSRLQTPARHGVHLKEITGGGDLDVVAFVNDIRVFVECKTSKPSEISEKTLRLFLQRAADFSPEIALLLVDTDSPVNGLVDKLNAILNATYENNSQSLAHQSEGKELYWGARNIFVANVCPDIETSLLAVNRLYYSHVRHMLYIWGEERIKPHFLPPETPTNVESAEENEVVQ